MVILSRESESKGVHRQQQLFRLSLAELSSLPSGRDGVHVAPGEHEFRRRCPVYDCGGEG